MLFPIPDQFARRMVALHGAGGAAWLRRLPQIIDACAQRWSLRVGPPFVPLSYNYVAPAVLAAGAAVVLKVGFPHPELMSEIEALRLYDGHGSVRLLAADHEQGALLLERLTPGTSLAQLTDDAAATSIAAHVMRQLWRPVPPRAFVPAGCTVGRRPGAATRPIRRRDRSLSTSVS